MPKKLSKTDLEKLDKASLIELLLKALERIEALETELEKLKRQKHRQAAPFSRNTYKPNPKPVGRKKGLGKWSYKTPPQAHEITKTIEVKVLESHCPKCQTELPIEASHYQIAYILEMPLIKQQITKYELEQKTCLACGLKMKARHARVSLNQQGVTAFQLSPEVMALAHSLQYGQGIPSRKVSDVLSLSCGVSIGQSAISQAAMKNSLETTALFAAYKSLKAELHSSPQINTDDTSWRVNGSNHQLMTARGINSVVYQIRANHSHKEVLELIPTNYQGVLGTDRFRSYNHSSLENIKQQKCLYHIIKNIKTQLETQKGRARDFPLKLKTSFIQALKLHQHYRKQKVSLEEYIKRAKPLKRVIAKLLKARSKPLCKINESLRAGLEYHQQRGNLLRFLDFPEIHATNNLAEQALRPAVIFRKLCAGSKNKNGARAMEVYLSVLGTAKLRKQDPVRVLAELYSRRTNDER